ncbi:MAG: hypothetical protein GY869_27990 [Planctomycetes bacterium]|nr:hypothetical protein [Planctomycetota bacterium]
MTRPKSKRKKKHLLQNIQTRNSDRHCRELTCRAYRFQTIDEKNRTVDAVIATDDPVMVFDMKRWEPILESLSMDGVKHPKRVPFLDSHDQGSTETVMGSTSNFRIEGGKLLATNTFSSVARADELWTKIREGHVTDNSIGYRVTKYEDIEPGKSADVNGRSYTAPDNMPLRVSTDWEIKENSAVPIGADAMAKNRNELITGDDVMKKFTEWLRARGKDINDLSEAQTKLLREVYDAEEKKRKETGGDDDKERAKPTKHATESTTDQNNDSSNNSTRQNVAPPEKSAKEAVAEERQRVASIRTEGGTDAPELVVRAIDEGMAIDEFRAELLKVVRSNYQQVSAPGVIIRDNSVSRQTLEAAMLLRGNYNGDEMVKDPDYGDEVTHRAAKLQRSMSLIDMCRHAVAISGGNTVGLDADDLIRTAFSTSTLPQLLGNAANKQLLAGYRMAPATWREWCSIGTVSDFKAHKRLRGVTTGAFAKVGNDGEISHGSYDEEYENLTAYTYAKQFGITRQDIINNDVSSFSQVPAELGRDAAKDLGDLVYTVLLANAAMADSIAIFHASHSNLNTSSSLTSANVTAAIAAFMNQTDKASRPIAIDPTMILVPPALRGTAEGIFQSEYLIATGVGSSAATVPSTNVNRGTVKPIVDPRLSNATFTGYSATTWYMVASPVDGAKNVEVGFLNGVQTPTIKQYDPGVNYVGGIQYQAYFDAGVAAIDFRTMSKNTA